VRDYWENALRRIPDLRFELLEDGKVYKALAHYGE
jgi:hypothetical protein